MLGSEAGSSGRSEDQVVVWRPPQDGGEFLTEAGGARREETERDRQLAFQSDQKELEDVFIEHPYFNLDDITRSIKKLKRIGITEVAELDEALKEGNLNNRLLEFNERAFSDTTIKFLKRSAKRHVACGRRRLASIEKALADKQRAYQRKTDRFVSTQVDLKTAEFEDRLFTYIDNHIDDRFSAMRAELRNDFRDRTERLHNRLRRLEARIDEFVEPRTHNSELSAGYDEDVWNGRSASRHSSHAAMPHGCAAGSGSERSSWDERIYVKHGRGDDTYSDPWSSSECGSRAKAQDLERLMSCIRETIPEVLGEMVRVQPQAEKHWDFWDHSPEVSPEMCGSFPQQAFAAHDTSSEQSFQFHDVKLHGPFPQPPTREVLTRKRGSKKRHYILPASQVHVVKGQKPIEEVRRGDRLRGGAGSQPAVVKSIRKLNDEVRDIVRCTYRVGDFRRSFCVTADQPVPVLQQGSDTYIPMPAGDLQEHDQICAFSNDCEMKGEIETIAMELVEVPCFELECEDPSSTVYMAMGEAPATAFVDLSGTLSPHSASSSVKILWFHRFHKCDHFVDLSDAPELAQCSKDLRMVGHSTNLDTYELGAGKMFVEKSLALPVIQALRRSRRKFNPNEIVVSREFEQIVLDIVRRYFGSEQQQWSREDSSWLDLSRSQCLWLQDDKLYLKENPAIDDKIAEISGSEEALSEQTSAGWRRLRSEQHNCMIYQHVKSGEISFSLPEVTAREPETLCIVERTFLDLPTSYQPEEAPLDATPFRRVSQFMGMNWATERGPQGQELCS